MAFSVPTFNLTCNIFDGPWLTRVLRLTSPCNLAYGRRVTQLFGTDPQTDVSTGNAMQLLLPASTDIRDFSNAAISDCVECPAGSGRWYGVSMVDDVGKGFDNEYRLAIIDKIYQAKNPLEYPLLFWPVPMT